jgi:hypothetical protein
MATDVRWETSMDAALSRAAKENKLVFLDFFNPE